MATEQNLRRLAEAAIKARAERRWTKTEAAQQADMAPKTYRRVEEGQPVQDNNLSGIDKAFEWPPGTARLISLGRRADGSLIELEDEKPEEPAHLSRSVRLTALAHQALGITRLMEELQVEQKVLDDFRDVVLRLFELSKNGDE